MHLLRMFENLLIHEGNLGMFNEMKWTFVVEIDWKYFAYSSKLESCLLWNNARAVFLLKIRKLRVGKREWKKRVRKREREVKTAFGCNASVSMPIYFELSVLNLFFKAIRSFPIFFPLLLTKSIFLCDTSSCFNWQNESYFSG